MYFTTKTLVIALAAGAVAIPADAPAGGSAALSKPKMGGKSPVGCNTTHPKPPPGDAASPPFPNDKEMEKRDFLGIPFPNITDLFPGLKDNKGNARRSEKEGAAKLPGRHHHGGKNMTKPAGLRLRKATKVLKRADNDDASGPPSKPEKSGRKGGDDEEDGPPKTETSGAPKPKKPEGSGAPKPKRPEASGAPKKPEPSGTPEPKESEEGDDEEGEDGGEGEESTAAAAGKKQPCPPKNGTIAAAGSKHNGTRPHPPGPKTKQGKRNVRAPAAPIRFWA